MKYLQGQGTENPLVEEWFFYAGPANPAISSGDKEARIRGTSLSPLSTSHARNNAGVWLLSNRRFDTLENIGAFLLDRG